MRVVIPILVALAVIGGIIYEVTQINTHGVSSACQVIDKDRVSGKNSSDMRVYTQNCGTFQIQDTFFGKSNFNSADLYASVQVGHTYTFETRGYRVGAFSSFPLILTATEV